MARELLDPVVAGVCHIDVAQRVDRDPPWAVELPRAITFLAPLGQEISPAVELLDAVIDLVRDVDVPGEIDGDIPAVEERPFKGAFLAPHEDRLPVGRVLLDPVIEGVGDVGVVVLVDAHAPRIVEDSLRGALPGEAELAPDGQEVPVLVELLDAVVIGVNNDQVALGGAG